MDDLQHGTRNKRGDWAPKRALQISPLFTFPPNPIKILKWLARHKVVVIDLRYPASVANNGRRAGNERGGRHCERQEAEDNAA
jgi:hypothetical protein